MISLYCLLQYSSKCGYLALFSNFFHNMDHSHDAYIYTAPSGQLPIDNAANKSNV